MADFIGVENNGNGANGYLIVNGNVYPATSGGGSYTDIPAGNYTYGDATPVRADQPTMTGQPAGTKRVTDAQRKPFSEFHILGTGPQDTIWESRPYRSKEHGKWVDHPNGDYRDGIEFHYDGGNPGTAGCIGYGDPAAKGDLIADPDKSVHVQYEADDAAARAEVEKRLKRCIDWSQVKKKPPTPIPANGVQSKNKKNKKVTKGDPSVKVGKKQRHIAHKQAMLEGGTQVAEGNPTVLVGTSRYPVSRVDHLTTDGSPLDTGEETVMMS